MPPTAPAPRRLVVKLGTGTLTTGIGKLDTARLDRLAGDIAALRQRGIEVIVVSSGAVGLGMGQLGIQRRPTRLSALQKCAAVGQSILIETWRKAFAPSGLQVAQLLLTREDVRSRNRHVALKSLFDELLAEGIVPVVNENDSVSAEEIKFGDNDVLSALVAILTRSDLLVILSTIPGLLDLKGDGELIPVVETIDDRIVALAGGTTSATAVGGMASKIEAARIATRSGCGLFIGSGSEAGLLSALLDGTAPGTFFVPSKLPMQSRKRWIAFFQPPQGIIHIDAGAERALRSEGRSLLAKGVVKAEGQFEAGDAVALAGPDGKPFARGLSRFSRETVDQLRGKTTEEIRRLQPELNHTEIIHRDALVIH